MKYLPLMTVSVWIGFLAGVIFTTDFFLLTSVRYPAIALIAILLTVSFWELQVRGRKLHAMLMAGILFLNLAGLTFGLSQAYSANITLSGYHGGKITPTLIGVLNSIDSINERSLTDKILFGRQGVPLPFLLVDIGATGLPEDQEKSETLSHIVNRWGQILSAKRELSYHVTDVFLMLVLSVTIILTLIIYLILFDKPKPEPAT